MPFLIQTLLDVRGGELAIVLDVQSLFIFLKENWICAMARHDADQTLVFYRQVIFFLTMTSESQAIL